jgi:hypothetical protein
MRCATRSLLWGWRDDGWRNLDRDIRAIAFEGREPVAAVSAATPDNVRYVHR